MNLSAGRGHQPFKIGERIPYFSLEATDGKIYSAASFEGSQCLIIIFTSNHCPYAKLYEDRIIQAHHEFRDLGVNLIAICSNDGAAFPEDSFENMKLKDYPFPYLYDEHQLAAKAFDAQATPEAFVFDANNVLRYHGAIDDSPESKNLAKQHFLKDAVMAVVRGEQVDVTEAPLIGCSIKWKMV